MPTHPTGGSTPLLGRDVTIAPGAHVFGDVQVGDRTAILPGAVVTAQDGRVTIGADCVVMENAVLRATASHPLDVGDRVLVGPTAYVAGCQVGDEAFLATGSRVFHGARLAAGVEVRVNATVHLRSEVPADTVVPIGWVAVGAPAQLFPPQEHDAIWAVQEPMDFPGFLYDLPRAELDGRLMATLGPRYAAYFRGLYADT